MRDPVRIKRILNKLEAIWTVCPDLRLGQLYIAVSGIVGEDFVVRLFNLEDERFEARLDEWIAEHGITVSDSA